MSEQNFKTALSGFNKQEVLDFIKNQDDAINGYKAKIEELEAELANQLGVIRTKNNEIETLVGKVEAAQQRESGKIKEMSAFIDEVNDNELHLKEEYEQKEIELIKQIKEAEQKLEENQVDIQKQIADAVALAKKDNEKEISAVESKYETRLSDLEATYKRQIEEAKNSHSSEISRVQTEYQNKLQEVKESAFEIKASLEAAKNIEADARLRAQAMISDAQSQCTRMKQDYELEISQKRREMLGSMEKELLAGRNEVIETQRTLKNLLDAIDGNKNAFVNECDKLRGSIQGIINNR